MATKPTSSLRSSCLPLLLSALLFPAALLLLIIGLSFSENGRQALNRVGSAFQVLQGETPTLQLNPAEKHDQTSSTAASSNNTEHTDSQTRNPATPQANSPDSTETKAPPEQIITHLPELPSHIPNQPTWDTNRLFNGVVIETSVQQNPGATAQEERHKDQAYRAHWQVEVTIPSPARSLEQLQLATPELGDQLPQLKRHLQDAELSRIWNEMYRRKLHYLGDRLTNLSSAPYRHNFFDLNTALNLRADDGTRAYLMQADMDIVTDGSDGDRLPNMPEEVTSSTHYQYSTSYGWPKQSDQPNPLLALYQNGNRDANRRLADYRQQLNENPSSERRQQLNQLIQAQQNRKRINQGKIDEMRARSFLIAEHDPFIVIPTWVITYRGVESETMPRVGDYAVVLKNGKALPAIVGDAGPNRKVGEASLRLAREINPEVTSYVGAVNDLSITYLIFPGSADRPFGPPDYDHWHQRCSQLLQSFGGLGENYPLHRWQNTLPSPADSQPSDSAGQ